MQLHACVLLVSRAVNHYHTRLKLQRRPYECMPSFFLFAVCSLLVKLGLMFNFNAHVLV